MSDIAAWRATVDRWVELDAPHEEATARLHLAEALLAGINGRAPAARAAARAELDTAHAIAERLPAPPLAAAVDDIRRRSGILERALRDGEERHVAGPLAGLTPRERDVLELVAAGRTNGQIAGALYISTKTASVHVSNILRKLEVTNRVEAAALAHHLTNG